MKKWQDFEKGDLCVKFAKLVDSWNEDMEVQCLYSEKTMKSEIFDMSVDGVKFSFRRVNEKYTLQFDGAYEFIQKSTFDFFKVQCEAFIRSTRTLLS